VRSGTYLFEVLSCFCRLRPGRLVAPSIIGFVTRSPDWKQAAAAADLEPGERLWALIPAVTPAPDHGSGGLVVLPPLIPLMMAAQRAAWRTHAHGASVRSGFPLAPRLIIGVTDRRLMIWTARRRWRTGVSLGSVKLDRIVAAEASTVGSGWRSVMIRLSSQQELTIKVPATAADRLAAALSDPAGGVSAASDHG